MGLSFDGPPEDWVAIKATGSLVCLDADGNIDTWHFHTDGCQPFEAMGLIAEYQAILADQAPYIYFTADDDDE